MKLLRSFNIRVNANKIKFENPNIGPVLSPYLQRDIILQICNTLEPYLQGLNSDLLISVQINVFQDKSYNCIVKGPKLFHILQLLKQEKKIYFLTDLYMIYYYKFYKFNFIKNSKKNLYLFCKESFQSFLKEHNNNYKIKFKIGEQE